MTKKFYNKVTVLLIVAIVMQMTYIPRSSAMGIEQLNDLEFNDCAAEQEDALDAYNDIIEGLKSGKLNEDMYAGAYIDGTKLVIMLTDLTDEIKNEYLAIVENQDTIDFEQARYSLKYLNEQVDEAVNILNNYPITEYGVYESKNEGFIRIDKEYYDSFVSELPAVFSEHNSPIIFEPGEYCNTGLAKEEMESELFAPDADGEEYYATTADKDIMGGMPLKTSLGNSTIGYCGYYGIMDAIIVAGHAVSDGENTEYGKVVQRQCANNQYGDYAIIFVDSNYRLTNNICDGTLGSLEVRQVYSNVPVGTTVSAYGIKTKTFSGTVTATNVSKKYVGSDVTIRGLTEVACDYACATSGDSGGPVYVVLGNYKVAACGIIAADDRKGKMHFVPFEHIASAFSPKTSP